ncbi:GGDEF domain-containing protein [Algiphilus aromaticivorans]|uniref:GGDEF domain-containing protein n=1 Tax=Algiphilus aromaticivorans TaxID=382454 RepID=UPI000694F9E1|nr:GGDEF domain-containing protein [Algiphilus aromaticivorans]
MLPLSSRPTEAAAPAPIDLLDSAVALTREKERAALRSSLLRTLSEMLPISELRMQDVAAATQEEAGEGWYMLPLAGVEREGRVLAVQLAEPRDGDERILQSFLRLYENFLAVIDESERDQLTGMLNRRAFDLRLGAVTSGLSGPLPSGQAWLALLDIDHFKRINDGYGHLFGDEVLVLLARLLRAHFGVREGVYRYGGEEFALVLAGETAEAVQRRLDGFRAVVAEQRFPGVGNVTLSAGFCAIARGVAPPLLVEYADRALYAAKDGGRDRVVAYESLPEARQRRSGDIELF